MSEDLCRCRAHSDDDPDSHHTEADHRFDCSGSGPDVCGGCWKCLAMQAAYYERRAAEGGAS